MRIRSLILILAWLTSPGARAQEAKPKPERVEVQVKKLVDDKDAALGQLAIEVRAYMLAELRFARAVCGLSKDEYKALGKDALGRCDRLAKDLLPAYLARAKPDPKATPPTAAIEDALAKVVKSHATPAQWASYEGEIKKRRDDRRDSDVEIILFTMDRHLLLSIRQRDQIRRGLLDHWNPIWSVAAINAAEGGPLIPKVPDELVIPSLSPAQKAMWTKRATLALDPFMTLELARLLGSIGGQDDDLGTTPLEPKEIRP